MKVKLFLFFVAIALTSCWHEMPKLRLPEKTMEGKNTLGCLVNKRVWSNYGTRCYTFGCDTINLSSEIYKNSQGDFQLTIQASYTVTKPHRIFQDVRLLVQEFKGEGIYVMSDGTMQFDDREKERRYSSDGSRPATVLITKYDSINRIISGEFSGVLPNRNGSAPENVEITEGRFDLTFQKSF